MTNNQGFRIAVALGAAVASYAPGWELGVARADGTIGAKIWSADPNDLARVNGQGRLRRTDEEFTNEQAVVKFFGDGKTGLFVEMRTGALSTGETPTDRMQAACAAVQLTNTNNTLGVAMIPGTEHFVTDNRGNEYRNANKPELMPINGGNNMLLMFNYQPDTGNDTKRYAKVLDKACHEIPVTNANGQTVKQVRIMAKQDDDCDMHQTGEGPGDIVSDAGGVTHLVLWAGCNGNGRDDGWLNDITVTCQNDANGSATSCQIAKNFDLALALREERSRGRCTVADEDPNTAVCTWTEGNNQPQRDGTWIAAVDLSAGGEQGPEAQSRLLWKQQIDGRNTLPDGRHTYSVRAKHTRILSVKPDGSLVRTNMIAFQSGDLRGNNNDNNGKGGTYYRIKLAVIKATRAGMEYVVPLTDATNMLLGIDGTHLSMCPAVFGQGADFAPGITLLQGSHNGGGVAAPQDALLRIDLDKKVFVNIGAQAVFGQYDRHLYSNYLGNNPGFQGRNFAGCTLIKDPFAAKTQFWVAHALTGKDPADVNNAALKPSSYLSMLSL
jgi:hypothetical protein